MPLAITVPDGKPSTTVSDGKPSYYKEVRLSPPEDPRGIEYVAAPDAPPDVPADLATLRDSYSGITAVVSVLFADPQEAEARKFLLERICKAANHDLCGTNYSVADGRANIADLKGTVTDQAYKIRDKRLLAYTWYAVGLGALPLVLGLIAQYVSIPGDHLAFGLGQQKGHSDLPYLSLQIPLKWIAIYFYVLAGSTIGVWAEFAMRMQGGLTFDQLLNLDPSRWKPFQRVLVTAVIASIFAFVLAFDAVKIGVGNILLNDFATTEPLFALVIGGVTGIAFPAVRDIVYRLKPEERK